MGRASGLAGFVLAGGLAGCGHIRFFPAVRFSATPNYRDLTRVEDLCRVGAMKTMKRIIGAGWAGWAKVMLGISRLGYSMFQGSSTLAYSADKRARSLGARR